MMGFYCNGKKDICYAYDNCNECHHFDGSGMAESEVANPYWKRIEAIANRQRAKGMSKYGQGLESNPAAIRERISHLQEELIDGLMYCEWIKDHFAKEGTDDK